MNINFFKTTSWSGSRAQSQKFTISSADSGAKKFYVAEDITTTLVVGGTFKVGSDVYTIKAFSFNSPDTEIEVKEAIISESGDIEYVSIYNYNSLLASTESSLDVIYDAEISGLTIDTLISFDVYCLAGKYSGICNYRGNDHHEQHRYQGDLVFSQAEKDDIINGQELTSVYAV